MLKEDQRVDLISHLSELRARILRALVYVVVFTTLVWVCYDPVFGFVTRPVVQALGHLGGKLNYRTFLEPFMIRMEICLVGGVLAAIPFIFYEVWGFVAPGLTRTERRAVRPLVPASGVLFLMGVAMAYLLTYPSIVWMLRFAAPDTQMLLNMSDNLLLILKFYVAFGLGFQLPIVLVLLAAIGIVNSRLLIRYWREATVGIFIVAAIITPTWDPFTMTIAALPMVILYLATIGIVRIMERRRRRAEAEWEAEGESEPAEEEAALAAPGPEAPALELPPQEARAEQSRPSDQE